MRWTTKSQPTTDPSSSSQPSSSSPLNPKTDRPTTNSGVNTIPVHMPDKLAEVWNMVKDGPKDTNTSRVLDAVGVSSALVIIF